MTARLLIAALLLATTARAQQPRPPAQVPVIGLITKTEGNPFFVKMREGAEAAAKAGGARLLTAAGKNDADNAGQVTALENMIAAGARAVLITPSDARAIVPAIQRARAKGVLVLGLDNPTDPTTAVDALYATDNYEAGVLAGRYARAALGGRPVRAATLDLFVGNPTGAQRHNGFLAGLGLAAPDARSSVFGRPPQLVCAGDTFGDQGRGRTVMENCLQKNPDLTVVFAVNEPSAEGAARALAASGKTNGVVLVAIDGGCPGVRAVGAGAIAATAQQYPIRMAELGVAAALHYIKTGTKPNGFVNTGVALITARPVAGVPSRDVAAGLAACFGRK